LAGKLPALFLSYLFDIKNIFLDLLSPPLSALKKRRLDSGHRSVNIPLAHFPTLFFAAMLLSGKIVPHGQKR
jgi:hypothetical protein